MPEHGDLTSFRVNMGEVISRRCPNAARVSLGDIKFNRARFRGSLVAGTHLQIRRPRARTQSSGGMATMAMVVVVVRACLCTLRRS